MTDQPKPDGPPPGGLSKKTLLMIVGGGLLVALAVVVLFVLPVEYRIDPTGFGRMTGLDKLGTPKEVAFTPPPPAAAAPSAYLTRYADGPFRTDTITIPLDTIDNGTRKEELEYKVRMKEGAGLVYSWSVPGIPNEEEFYYDFHGHTPPNPDIKVAEYKKSTGTSSNGVLIAPFDGIHGWYLQNQSAKPVVVTLKLAGFYELVAPGEAGNESGILAPG
jgi:hypothetical protein